MAYGNSNSFPKDIPPLIDPKDKPTHLHFPHRANNFAIPMSPDILKLTKRSFMEEEVDRATSFMHYISRTTHMAYASAIRETMDVRRSDGTLL